VKTEKEGCLLQMINQMKFSPTVVIAPSDKLNEEG
jgi:hypothetical protein